MSLIHRMTLARHGLGTPMDFYGQVVGDPIFLPLFTAMGLSNVAIAGLGGISAAGIASALATGGGYKEFPI